ncbi:MAG: prepilin-type N-terminal cleavage/methylation domain-containing protein [Candidatus Omnitrophica bacterium]|nr:prepilin-type N-terminal cleavage/methylation domain-containing protein [Candidatus Omnitrophota bacterium]
MTDKGLSLIELIISLAVIAMILSLLYSVFFVTLHTFGFGERQRDVVASAGWAMETMVKEIRQARAIYNISNIYVTNKFYTTDIEILTGNGLEWFRFYIAEDSQPYRLLRANLTGFINGKGKPLAENVKDFQTEYYDRNNAKISDPVTNKSDVRLILFSLEVEKVSKTSGGTQDVILKARVRPRTIN